MMDDITQAVPLIEEGVEKSDRRMEGFVEAEDRKNLPPDLDCALKHDMQDMSLWTYSVVSLAWYQTVALGQMATLGSRENTPIYIIDDSLKFIIYIDTDNKKDHMLAFQFVMNKYNF